MEGGEGEGVREGGRDRVGERDHVRERGGEMEGKRDEERGERKMRDRFQQANCDKGIMG